MQIKTRQRVRDLAEVYTHSREVNAMLDLVPDMFPNAEDPRNTDRKFFEPAAGSGNFLEEILVRKLAFVTRERYQTGQQYEHRILRALASIYAIDIDAENVAESKDRLRSVIISHLDNDLNTCEATAGFVGAVDIHRDVADGVELQHLDAMTPQARRARFRACHRAIDARLARGQRIDEIVGGAAGADADNVVVHHIGQRRFRGRAFFVVLPRHNSLNSA